MHKTYRFRKRPWNSGVFDTTQYNLQPNLASSADPLLRYEAAYANAKRKYELNCRACEAPFGEGSLQLSVRVQSRSDDHKNAVPYHLKCFFDQQCVQSDNQISGFENLRIADQNSIQKYLKRRNNKVVKLQETPTQGSKRHATGGNGAVKVKMSKKALRDFGVEYSKSSRAMCCGCRQKILKNLVRCKKVIYNTEMGLNFGGQALWHHLDCFAKLQSELGWYGDGAQLAGFNELTAKDQEIVRLAICPVALDSIPEIKKLKQTTTAEEKQEAKSLANMIEAQNKSYFANLDLLESTLKSEELIHLLRQNNQEIPDAEYDILNAAADLLTFGALAKCPACNTGQMVLRKRGFGCSGQISEWAKCDYFAPRPVRSKCTIPSWMPQLVTGTALVVHDRVFKEVEKEPTAAAVVGYTKPKVIREKPPLYLMEIVVLGRLSKTRAELKTIVEPMGGKLSTKLHANTAVVVSTQKELNAMGAKMVEAQNLGIQVVLEEFLEKVQSGAVAVDYISKHCISSWGSDPATRINENERSVVKSSGMYTRFVPKTVKLKVINGTAVDPESGLADSCHVFIDDNVKYFATLNHVDIQAGKNSYYKLQVLETDNPNNGRYYLFTSRGRIGTIIGTKDTTSYSTSQQAVQEFSDLYTSLTGNAFGTKNFRKQPNKYYPIDVQFEDESEASSQAQIAEVPSKLAQPVQDLMRIIFDVNQMKQVMREFDLDTLKMPLGKISSAQVMKAMTVLQTMSNLVRKNGRFAELVGASNHFYSLIPHDFGTMLPSVISTLETIKEKNEMLQSLLEMEIAYSLMNKKTDTSSSGTNNRLDRQYEMLNTDLERIDSASSEYQLLVRYLKNTHADTHNTYTLEVQDVFRVCRSGEQERFEPFEHLPNRMLLWHGSRLTNYAGILSQGLRIAPPEAPATGYMFGKGIYFADMVSKSANYCFTSHRNSTGLVMLCDVALGNWMECTSAKDIVELPRGIHSVKGVGRTYPDPRKTVTNDDGIAIPLGRPQIDLDVNSSLLYNEYIVYDMAQVQIKYLFKLKFNHQN